MEEKNETNDMWKYSSRNKMDPQGKFTYLNILVDFKTQILNSLNPAPSFPQRSFLDTYISIHGTLTPACVLIV